MNVLQDHLEHVDRPDSQALTDSLEQLDSPDLQVVQEILVILDRLEIQASRVREDYQVRLVAYTPGLPRA